MVSLPVEFFDRTRSSNGKGKLIGQVEARKSN